MTSNNSLPREVLKWLQSLQLSYTYKNPKQYFPHDPLLSRLCMFVNGNTTQSKLANWDLLDRFFRRNKIGITQDCMDAVMHGLPNASTIFLRNLYLLITRRRVKFVELSKTQFHPDVPTNFAFDEIARRNTPHFQLPTTSHLIKNMPNSEFILTQDLEGTRKKVRSIIQWQEEILKDVELNNDETTGDIETNHHKNNATITSDISPLNYTSVGLAGTTVKKSKIGGGKGAAASAAAATTNVISTKSAQSNGVSGTVPALSASTEGSQTLGWLNTASVAPSSAFSSQATTANNSSYNSTVLSGGAGAGGGSMALKNSAENGGSNGNSKSSSGALASMEECRPIITPKTGNRLITPIAQLNDGVLAAPINNVQSRPSSASKQQQ